MPMAVERRGLSIQSQCNTVPRWPLPFGCIFAREGCAKTLPRPPRVNALAGSLARDLAALSLSKANASDRSYLVRVRREVSATSEKFVQPTLVR